MTKTVALNIIFSITIYSSVSSGAATAGPIAQGLTTRICQPELYRTLYPENISSLIRARQKKVESAIRTFDQRLLRSGPEIRRGWLEYLNLESLKAKVASASIESRPTLKKTIERLHGPYAGLEEGELQQLRLHLRQYLAILEHASQRDPRGHLREILSRLTVLLSNYPATTMVELNEMASLRSELSDLGFAPDFSGCIAAHYGNGNIHVDIGLDVIPPSIFDSIHERTPVHRNRDGARITGVAQTVATPKLEFYPNKSAADIRVSLTGSTLTNLRASQQSVNVYSTLSSQHRTTKRIGFNGSDFFGYETQSNSYTQARVNQISTPRRLGHRIVRKIARRKAASQMPSAARESSRTLERTLRQRLDEKVHNLLYKANKYYDEFIQIPLQRLGFKNPFLKSETSNNSLHATMRIARYDQLSATYSAPKFFRSTDDIGISLHESYFLNHLGLQLSGSTVSSDVVQRGIGFLFSRNGSENPVLEKWRLTFSDTNPFLVELRDGIIKISVRIKEFSNSTVTADPNSPIFIEATYLPLNVNGKIELHRNSDVVIQTQPSFDPDLLQYIKEQSELVFGRYISLEPVDLPALVSGASNKKIIFTGVSSRVGWLQLNATLR